MPGCGGGVGVGHGVRLGPLGEVVCDDQQVPVPPRGPSSEQPYNVYPYGVAGLRQVNGLEVSCLAAELGASGLAGRTCQATILDIIIYTRVPPVLFDPEPGAMMSVVSPSEPTVVVLVEHKGLELLWEQGLNSYDPCHSCIRKDIPSHQGVVVL